MVLLFAGIVWTTRQPSGDRDWSPDQAVMPSAEFHGHEVTIRRVRDFAWTSATEFTNGYDDRTYDLDKIQSAWFVLVPFSKSWRGPAHSFASFGFADSQFVSISIEARRETGESYSTLLGLLRKFELIYVVGDERDLIGRRAVYDGTDVYLYPLESPPERVREVFVSMLQRVNQLHDHPEFYNTLTNNCTSNLIADVNHIAPGSIPGSWRTVLPGYSDEVALSLGLIDSSLTLEQTRARYRINDMAAKYFGQPDFSLGIRNGH
ncbi:MAG TPA: DUF4105 domain-containing protein [Gemmatimonadales bacterium]|nr:DUF4105 domain-containing protein [Gemmatimonadales bacterium]